MKTTENIVYRDATPTLDWSANQVANIVNILQKKFGKLSLAGTSFEAKDKEYQLIIFSRIPLSEEELVSERKYAELVINK